MVSVVLVSELADLLIFCAIAVALIALMFAFENRKLKRARRKWFASRSGEPDLPVDGDAIAAAMVAFVAEDADVPADLLRSDDRIDVLFAIGLDDEELLPFIKRRFGVKLKSEDVCPLVRHDKGWQPRPISLGELISLVNKRNAGTPSAAHRGFCSR